MRELDEFLITEGKFKTTFKWSFPERRAIKRKKLRCGPGFKAGMVNGVPMCIPESGLEKTQLKVKNIKAARTFKREGPAAARIKKSKFRKAWKAGEVAGTHESFNGTLDKTLLKESVNSKIRSLIPTFKRFFMELTPIAKALTAQKVSSRTDAQRAIERWDGILLDYLKTKNIEILIEKDGKKIKTPLQNVVSTELGKVISLFVSPTKEKILLNYFSTIIADEGANAPIDQTSVKTIFDYIVNPQDVGIEVELKEASYMDRLRGTVNKTSRAFVDSFLFSAAMVVILCLIVLSATQKPETVSNGLTSTFFINISNWVLQKLNTKNKEGGEA